MHFIFKPAVLAISILCISSLSQAQHKTDSPAASRSIALDYLDKTVRIQDDLYRATNGAWLKRTRIPADKSEVYAVDTPHIVKQRVKKIIQDLALRRHPTGRIEQKIGDYYQSFLNVEQIEKQGKGPLLPLLEELDAITTTEHLAAWEGKYHGIIKTPIWLWGGFADFQNPKLNRAIGMQGGLGLPDRAYYLQLDDPRYQEARTAYITYLTRLATLIQMPKPEQLATSVFALETKIAEVEIASEEAMNPGAVQTWGVIELEQKAPGFAWQEFLNHANISNGDKINFMQPSAVIGIAKLHQTLALADWKNYFKMRLITESALVLPQAFRQAYSEFHAKTMGAALQDETREPLAVTQVSEALSEALSQSYVQRHFPAQNKIKIQTMFDHLIRAAKESVNKITWMNATTKQEALAKLSAYKAKIAYPEHWRDYTKLSIKRGDALGNQHRAKRFEWERQAAMSGTAVNRSLWMMSPLEVNAYYDPSLNEINLPAAFLQKPFFDPEADEASNYGRLGAFIAHEISHGFDSNGAQFDSKGVMRNWWSAEDQAQFKLRQSALITFYDQIEVLPGHRVNGKLTLPENIADILGLQMAYQAYQISLADNTRSRRIDKSNMLKNSAQNFFIAYAQTWAVLRRDERTLALLANDPHAPAAVRCNATVMHVDAFHQAFKTQAGDKMYLAPEQRFRFW